MIVVELYFYVAGMLMIWFSSASLLVMDRHDRRQIKWVESIGMLLLSALLWPVILLKSPGSILRPARLYEMDTYRAKEERERERFKRELSQCPSQIRYISSLEGKQAGAFFFQSNQVATYLKCRKDNDGYGPTVRDLEEITSWFENSDPNNPQVSDIPWIWHSRELLVAELVESGLGYCFCSSCGLEYESAKIHSGTGKGSPGWIAVIVTCPEGHEVMKFDLLKPFCSHTSVNDSLENAQLNNEPHVPHFLKK